jgi:hypothetical protein
MSIRERLEREIEKFKQTRGSMPVGVNELLLSDALEEIKRLTASETRTVGEPRRCTCYVLPHADDCEIFVGLTQPGERVVERRSGADRRQPPVQDAEPATQEAKAKPTVKAEQGAHISRPGPTERDDKPQQRTWEWPCNTVGKLVANLQTLPPEMPFYTAYFVEIDGVKVTRTKSPSLSYETTDGFRVLKYDENDKSLVMWASLAPSATPRGSAGDGARYEWLCEQLLSISIYLKRYDHAHELPRGGFALYNNSRLLGYGETIDDAIDAAIAATESTATRNGADSRAREKS